MLSMNTKLQAFIFAAVIALGCCGCQQEALAQPEESPDTVEEALSEEEQQAITLENKVQERLEAMSIEEKVAQMFVLCPEAIIDAGKVVAADESTRTSIQEYPVGGFIYQAQYLHNAEQTRAMIDAVQTYSMERIGLPSFITIDEEGGTVTRISGTGKFDVPYVGDMADIGAAGDVEAAYETGVVIGEYLSDLGFNVDFAPVADVLSNEENTVVKARSFGSDAELVTEMCLAFSEGLESQGVYSTFKHFPGHGATASDTHKGYAYTMKTLGELRTCELVPFQAGIDAGIDFIMVSHISLPNVAGADTPASLSEFVITQILREEMGYDGIVITDAMGMGAVSQFYSSVDATIQAIKAGCDVILAPKDFYAAYHGVIEAVASGELSEKRIDMSVERILRVKLQMVEMQ